MDFYTEFAAHYEAIFPFSETVYSYLRRYLPAPPAAVLDVGCGTGHYVRRLERDGYWAVGIDLNAAMIDYARVHHPTTGFRVLNMLDITDLGQRFDAAACIGNTAAHLAQAQMATFLERVGKVLARDGVWVLQVMNWDYVIAQKHVVFPVIEGPGGVIFYREYRDISPEQVAFATRLEVGGATVFEDMTPLYPLRSDAIVALHEARGFALVDHAGSYGGAPFDPEVFSANIFVFRH